jgi:pilus assembly protein CpaB
MKAARLIVLSVALAAGGAFAFLVGSEDEKQPEAPAPDVQFATTDVLIAKSDIGMGTAISRQDLQWQA